VNLFTVSIFKFFHLLLMSQLSCQIGYNQIHFHWFCKFVTHAISTPMMQDSTYQYCQTISTPSGSPEIMINRPMIYKLHVSSSGMIRQLIGVYDINNSMKDKESPTIRTKYRHKFVRNRVNTFKIAKLHRNYINKCKKFEYNRW